MLTLTPKQKECVAFSDDSNLLVQGIAGSGKSLVLVNRAVRLKKKGEERGKHPRIALFTYVNSLIDYTREVAEALDGNISGITISTIDKQAVACYKRMFGNPGSIAYGVDKKLLSSIVCKSPHRNERLLRPEYRNFLVEELEWMSSRSIHDENTYVEKPRVGRGAGKGSIRVARKEREAIYQVYEKYFQAQSKLSADKMYERILDNADRIPDSFKYDYVMLDESQDLSLNKIRYAKAVACRALSIAADQSQKIYNNGFTWKEVGISIHGQASKKLVGTFRNTREIALLANGLLEYNTEREANKDEYVAPELPARTGPKPVLVREPSVRQENKDICALLQEELQGSPKNVIAILARSWHERDIIEALLKQQGFSYGIIDKYHDTKILSPGIKLVTIHSSKGLEFDTVIIPYLDADVFPPKFSEIGDDEKDDVMNQERNVLYVAMTRSKHALYIYTVNGNESPLIDELDPDNMKVIDRG